MDGTKPEEEEKDPNLWLGHRYCVRVGRLRNRVCAAMVHQEPTVQACMRETRHVKSSSPEHMPSILSMKLISIDRRPIRCRKIEDTMHT
jgi:hypothetical protein